MKKTIKLVLVSMFMVAVATSGMVAKAEAFGFDRDKTEGMHEKRGEKMDDLMREIGLTREQQERIKALKEEYREKGEDLREQLKTKRIGLRDELNKPQSDKAVLRKLVDETADLYRKRTEFRVEGVLEMKKVLTPGQFELLNEKMEIRKEVRRQLMEHKGRRPGARDRRNGR